VAFIADIGTEQDAQVTAFNKFCSACGQEIAETAVSLTGLKTGPLLMHPLCANKVGQQLVMDSWPDRRIATIGNSAASSKPTRNTAQLKRLILQKIHAVPELRGRVTDVHIAGVRWKDPGEGDGPNWGVPTMGNASPFAAAIARAVAEVQAEFDLGSDEPVDHEGLRGDYRPRRTTIPTDVQT
jgi:hypothetical protein